MSSAAYMLKLINSKQAKLSDFEKAPNFYMPIGELYRWLGITKESCPQLSNFITENCLAETFIRSEPCFKIALNSKNKLTLYLVERALNYFLTTHKLDLTHMGISPLKIEEVLNRFQIQKKSEDTYSLNHLLPTLQGRRTLLKYHQLPRKVIEGLLNEYITDENNNKQPLVFFTSVANRTTLSIQRENIPYLLKNWGQSLNIDEFVIKKTIHTHSLPDITSQMIDLASFSRKTKSSDSFMHWFSNMADFFFKEDFLGYSPALIKAKSANMQEFICLNISKIPKFIQKNKDILLFHGFNPAFIQQTLNEKQSMKEANKFPCLLVNQLAQRLAKSTEFIPILKSFIQENCLQDKFNLALSEKKEITAPVFLHYKSFSCDETLYIYEKALPDFVNAHLNQLLDMGVSFQVLNDILNEKRMGFSQKNALWSMKDFYLHSFSPLPEKKFNAVLNQYLKDTFHLFQKDGSLKKLNIFIQTPAKKNPIKMMSGAFPIILNKAKEKLSLSNLDAERLISLSLMEQIPEVIDVKNLCQLLHVPQNNVSKVTALFKNPKNRAYRQFFPDRSKRVIPVFGFSRDKAWGLKIGIYKPSLAFCLKLIQEDLIRLGAPLKRIQKLKQLTAYEKLSAGSNNTQHLLENQANRQKE